MAVVAIAAGATTFVTRDRGPGPPPPESVLTFNLCGNVCGEGANDSARFVADLAKRRNTTVLFLQEACRSQTEEVARLLERERGAVVTHYVTTLLDDRAGRNRCPGDDYGVAIVTSEAVQRSFELPLPNPGLGARQIDERAMPCLELGGPHPRIVCTTHLVRRENDARAHEAQVAAFRQHAADLRAQTPEVLLGGDFNAPARDVRVDGFLSAAEEERSVDRVLASSDAYRNLRAETHGCACSDHDALVVALQRRS